MEIPHKDGGVSTRTTAELVVDIAGDTAMLVRKEVQLAKQEVTESVVAKVKGVIAVAVAGVLALFAIGFGAAAGAYALQNVLEPWAARVVVAAAFLALAAIAAGIGLGRLKSDRPLRRTKKTLKEDARWAATQIKP